MLRLLLFCAISPWEPKVQNEILLRSDALGYHQLALVWLGDDSAREAARLQDPLRPPGYPVLLATFYRAFGVRAWPVLLFQCLVDALLCALLGAWIARDVGAGAGRWAAWLYALDPFALLQSNLLLTETTFLFLCVGGAWLFFARPLQNRRLALAGVFFGLATLLRPIPFYLPLLAPAALWLNVGVGRRAVTSAVVFGVALLVTVSPWLARNYVRYGEARLAVANEYNVLFDKFVGPREAARRGVSIREMHGELDREVERRMSADAVRDTSNEFVRARYWRQLATEHLRAEPLAYAGIALSGIAQSFVNLGTGPYAEVLRVPERSGTLSFEKAGGVKGRLVLWWAKKSVGEKALAAWLAAWIALTGLCTLRGIWALLREYPLEPRPFLVAALLIAAYFLVFSASAGNARYRLPALPFYLPITALGATRLFASAASTRRVPESSAGRDGR